MRHPKTSTTREAGIGAGAPLIVSIIIAALTMGAFSGAAYLDTTIDDVDLAESSDEVAARTNATLGARAHGTDSKEHEDDPARIRVRGVAPAEAAGCDDSDCGAARRPTSAEDGDVAATPRARTLRVVAAEAMRRMRSGGSSATDVEEPDDQGPDYSAFRQYLTDADEVPNDVRGVPEILNDPSNVVSEDGLVSLVAWDVRDREPRGSYLYVLQQDLEGQVTQLHRYFCPERRLDTLAEGCVPIASVYSNSGRPLAVRYPEGGPPVEGLAEELDPSLFSRGEHYLEAEEFLLWLQEYFDSLRG